MNSEEFFYLLEFLHNNDDFALLSLYSSLKSFKTEEEVEAKLIEIFGFERIQKLPKIRPEDLSKLIVGELATRNLN